MCHLVNMIESLGGHKVMRMPCDSKDNVIKFSELILKEMYGNHLGDFIF